MGYLVVRGLLKLRLILVTALLVPQNKETHRKHVISVRNTSTNMYTRSFPTSTTSNVAIQCQNLAQVTKRDNGHFLNPNPQT
jgi:hypothetical protein